MIIPADRIEALAETEIALMSQRSRELQAKGHDIINLSIGEPDFSTPEHIKEAAIEAIRKDFSHYPPIPGFPSLKKAISEKLQRENGLLFSPNQIVISNGAKQALANSLFSIVNPGDEVIIPTPYWVTYIELVKLAEGVSKIIETGIGQHFKITPQQLEAAITPKTRALLLNSPSNPTGAIYSRQELEDLAVVLRKHPKVLIISDEIYELISFLDEHPVSIGTIEGMENRVIVINGVSKGFAMTGWRIGYSASPLNIAQACVKLQSQYTSGACSIAQMAALAAYHGTLDEPLKMKEAFRRRRDLMVELAEAIPGFRVNVPQGAFYLFPDVSHYFGKSDGNNAVGNATDLSMYLLDKAQVATVTGNAFGDPDCLRISFAASDDQLITAMHRIKEALSWLQ
jgi:aspartate aminotransferase